MPWRLLAAESAALWLAGEADPDDVTQLFGDDEFVRDHA